MRIPNNPVMNRTNDLLVYRAVPLIQLRAQGIGLQYSDRLGQSWVQDTFHDFSSDFLSFNQKETKKAKSTINTTHNTTQQ
jgi:hypothetical protein